MVNVDSTKETSAVQKIVLQMALMVRVAEFLHMEGSTWMMSNDAVTVDSTQGTSAV